ncbi:PRC domain containing protein [Streptomyces venezuelae]|uniref:PRC domain containing protein n=1 Tax=Streptomyces venezuelae TaxID=54571 RepID=A0A5P2DUT6_STRVZ|nr:PRC-barrel domain containing protein [Streptomyces venezuelae]QES58097.1 PRC domain containing protein [Streptomyces venezuelae]
MAENMWAYRISVDYLAADLTGYEVEALDGSIGKVDQHSDEVTDAYLVVDTGGRIPGEEVLLPAGLVTRIDHAVQKIHVDRTKEQIEAAPEFRRGEPLADTDGREALGTHYLSGMPFGVPPA